MAKDMKIEQKNPTTFLLTPKTGTSGTVANAFIEIDPNNYAGRIQEAQKFLASAKDALNRAGFEGAGGRITTQPFPQYTKGMSLTDAVAFVAKLREAASKERSGLNIGAAMVRDNDDPAASSLTVEILSKISVNANLITADEAGIHWNAIRQAEKIIKQLSERSPHGEHDRRPVGDL